MIEQALIEHLRKQTALTELLTTYNRIPAIFNQEAPADVDNLWASGVQYSRIVFAEDIQGDPERTMGGTLVVDIMCGDGHQQFPETIEPILRSAIDGYFFSNDTFTVAAQWKNSSYFTQPKDEVLGCTVSFELLAFPVLTTMEPDVIDRLNKWSGDIDGTFVINHDKLPSTAWKPTGDETALYWRSGHERPAGWIPDTYSTIWRTATIRGHIFAEDISTATILGKKIIAGLYADKRLKKNGEAPIMVNRSNSYDDGADALRTGQLTVEATYGIIVYKAHSGTFKHINY